MRQWIIVLAIVLTITFIFSGCSPQPTTTSSVKPTTATTTTTSATTTTSSTTSTATSVTPIKGGTFKIIITRTATAFGYPPKIVGPDRDYCPPFFDRLLTIDNKGAYQPQLATSWEVAPDGLAITFKLRQGVKFHDGTTFDAAAVKFNFDALIPPNPVILDGVKSIEVVDPATVKVNLAKNNNLILYQIASNYECYIASPTAIQTKGVDWATLNPVGTGPFKFVSYERNVGMKFAKNADYWNKPFPYLDAIQINTVTDPMTQLTSFKAGEANAIYDAVPTSAAQLRDQGWPLLIAPGALYALSFDAKNSKELGNPLVRQAMEYAELV
jgi:peptide/nickel transport system substrate-binding protein